jgi:hypothetical protein
MGKLLRTIKDYLAVNWLLNFKDFAFAKATGTFE